MNCPSCGQETRIAKGLGNARRRVCDNCGLSFDTRVKETEDPSKPSLFERQRSAYSRVFMREYRHISTSV